MSYILITDSGSDLSYDYVKKNKIKMVSLKYQMGGEEFDAYRETTDDSWLKEFYRRLRSKESATTSCVNTAHFEEIFEGFAKGGRDFFYLAFSAKLSATYDMAVAALENIKAKYPERKMYVVNSRSASLGHGLFIDYLVEKRNSGMDIDALYQWAKDNRPNICQWFTVDDLFFLKRGGRISATTALAGTMLGVKPILHVDEEGFLKNVDKVRGRKTSLDALVEKFKEHATDYKNQRVFISHGDCYEDAKYVEKKIREQCGVKRFLINYIHPLVGTHSGPGTVALFFYGDKR